MSINILTEIIDTLQELKRLHQLNYELLEQLNVACRYFLENHVKMPNEEKILSLLSKAMTLLEEINKGMPSDEFLHRKKSDKDFTEPKNSTYISEIRNMLDFHCSLGALNVPTYISDVKNTGASLRFGILESQ